MGNSSKKPYMPVFTGDLIQDTRCLSPAARGIWYDFLLFAWRDGQVGSITLTWLDWARQLSCTVEEAQEAICELVRKRICDCLVDGFEVDPEVNFETLSVTCHGDVRKSHNEITVINRRMHREHKDRENARLRKQKQREREGHGQCHENVTLPLPYPYSSTREEYVFSQGEKPLGRTDENPPVPTAANFPPDKAGRESAEEYHAKYMAWAKARTEALLAEKRKPWEAAYPAVDLEMETAKALNYLDANPAKRKRNLLRYLTNWLSRTQERGGSRKPAGYGGGNGQGLFDRGEASKKASEEALRLIEEREKKKHEQGE